MPDRRRRISPEVYQRLVAEAKQAAKRWEPPPPEPSVVEKYLPMGLRGLGMLMGVTPLRGMGASAAAEGLAQGVEGRFSPSEILTAGVTGGIGGAATQSLFKNLSKPIVAAAKGAGWGAAQPVARETLGELGLAEEYDATPADIGTSAAIGGGVAGGLSKLLGRLTRNVPAAATPKEYPSSRYPLLSRTPKELEQLAVLNQAEGRPDVAIDVLKRTVEAPGMTAPPSLMNRLIALQKAEAARTAKASREAQAAEEIAAARADLGEPTESVSETISAPTSSGIERLTRVFKAEPPPKATTGGGGQGLGRGPVGPPVERIEAPVMPPEPTRDPEKIFQAWRIAQGLPDNMAIRRQFPWGQVGGEIPAVGGGARLAPEPPVRPVEPPVAPEPTLDTLAALAAPVAEEGADFFKGMSALAGKTVTGPKGRPRTLKAQAAEEAYEALKQRLAAEGKAPAVPDIPAVTPEAVPTARFLGWQPTLDGPPMALYNVEGGASHGSTVGVGTLEKLGITIPETPPPPVPATPAAIPEAPVSPLPVFKTPVDVAGTFSRQAKQEGNLPEVVRRYLGMSLQTEAKRAGLPTRGGAGSPEALQKFLTNEMGPAIAGPGAKPASPTEGLGGLLGGAPAQVGAEARVPGEVPPARPVTPPEAPVVPTPAAGVGPMVPQEPVSQPTSVGDLMERWAEEVEELGRMGLPPEKLDEASSQIVSRLMDEAPDVAKGFSGRARGEKGEVAFPLLGRLGLGLGGAAVGGATGDDPITGAMLGFSAGVTLPTLVKYATQAGAQLAADPNVPTSIKHVLAPLAEGKPEQAARTFWDQIPDYLRAGMLIGPNTGNNFFVGPWGAGMMAGLELKMAGDPMGNAILQNMHPANWAQYYLNEGRYAAQRLIWNTKDLAKERIETVPMAKWAQSPAIGMLAGDMTTRHMLQLSGMPEELARRYTATSEPVTNVIRKLLDFQRAGGTLAHVALPFAKTLGNLAEQSAIRTPILGPMIQRAHPRLAYPEAVQTQQQILGSVVPTAAMGVGYIAPDETSPDVTILGRMLRSGITNVAGPYAGLAGIGYGVGRALSSEEPTLGRTIQRGGTEALQSVPLPTADVPVSWLGFMRRLVDQEPITSVPAGVPAAGIINPVLRERAATGNRRSRRTRNTRTRRTER